MGRTLLTAFLLLSIVPLSLISFVASTQARRNLQRELEEKLVTISTLAESQVHSWIASQRLTLTLLANHLQVESQGDLSSSSYAGSDPALLPITPTAHPETGDEKSTQTFDISQAYKEIAKAQGENPTFMVLLLLDQQGRLLAAYPTVSQNHLFLDLTCSGEWCREEPGQQKLLEANSALIQALARGSDQIQSPALVLSQPVTGSELTLVALLDPRSLISTLSPPTPWSKSGEIYLVPPSGRALKLKPNSADTVFDESIVDRSADSHSAAVAAAMAGESNVGSYKNHQGVTVIGAYRWLSELNMVLAVEQPQDLALATSDDLAVVLIGAALAVAVFTALIAAAVTRRITLPIIQLTATAVQIAAGDLDQKVPATRRDEIGILARAFNVMTSKLRVLYENLEQQVRERTQQLRKANAQLSYRAMQLAISAEVAQVVTSILDREALLARVVELIRDCFQVYFVAVYFIDENGQWALLYKGSGGLGEKLQDQGYRVDLRQGSLISQAAQDLKPYECAGPDLDHKTDRQMFPHSRAELAVPLKIGQRRLGVLDVHSIHEDAFVGDEIMVLETLAGQIAVAIENARVYEMEHQAVKQLRALEESRRRFLTNMSRELRMPLNNIIGFSRVILKEIDGPITDLQREDLTAIHESGQQLLALVNDILDIAHIEAGAMELIKRPTDVGEVARSVIPTINALLEGRPIKLHHEIAQDLPPIQADPIRLRQVLIKLLSNAVKFTRKGEIALCVWPNSHEVLVSISDTGIGIPDEHREKVFEMFQQVSQPGSNTKGTGLGLTFSKEIIEMHGGTIQLESQEGKGTTFTIALPIIESTETSQQVAEAAR